MIFRTLLLIQAMLFVAFFAACSSTPKTEESAPKTPERSLGSGMVVDAANGQLAKVPVMGFPAFKTSMPIKQFDEYGENAATAAKTVVASMPAGYKLQITGHANAGTGKPAGFVKNISTERAKFVHAYFVKKGLDPAKMTYTGAGDTEQDPGLTREQNRRVTFKLVESK